MLSVLIVLIVLIVFIVLIVLIVLSVCWNSTQRIYPFVPPTPNRGPAGLESPTGQSTDRVLTRGRHAEHRWVAEAPIMLYTH